MVLSDSNTIRIDYVDSAGTQHYLYGNPVSKGAWHTIDVSETIGAGSGAVTLKVDGTTNASGANLDLVAIGVGSVMIGAQYSPPMPAPPAASTSTTSRPPARRCRADRSPGIHTKQCA